MVQVHFFFAIHESFSFKDKFKQLFFKRCCLKFFLLIDKYFVCNYIKNKNCGRTNNIILLLLMLLYFKLSMQVLKKKKEEKRRKRERRNFCSLFFSIYFYEAFSVLIRHFSLNHGNCLKNLNFTEIPLKKKRKKNVVYNNHTTSITRYYTYFKLQ